MNRLLTRAMLIPLISTAAPLEKPNIIVILADDISARELPVYGSSVWTPPHPKPGRDSTSDLKYQAHTPVLDRMAQQGCYIQTAWGATICSPSRAMLMTGRYAHLHKWWFNGDLGTHINEKGEEAVWPLYESSPLLIGHVAQQAGYRTMWAGKTQMSGADLSRFGFDSGVFTPGEDDDKKNNGGKPISDFRLIQTRLNKEKIYINADSGKTGKFSWAASSFYWQPSVRLMNIPYGTGNREWWPNTPESKATYGINTYGPDVELKFSLDFIDQQHASGKPFFIYHTMHLGHTAFDFLGQGGKWTGTPIVKWTGNAYIRTEPAITGDKGVYDTHSITPPSIHHQINYIDYQIWLYQKKLKELGIENNTVLIFCADNGTMTYGKASPIRQRGCHIPMIIYAPNMAKHGRQDILVNLADILPTLADIVGFKFPANYEVNGKSLWPYLTANKQTHRDWIYSYQGDKQLIRGHKVLRDGKGLWWNVEQKPENMDRYPQITDWSNVSEMHLMERSTLEKLLPRFDKHTEQHDAPITNKRNIDFKPATTKPKV